MIFLVSQVSSSGSQLTGSAGTRPSQSHIGLRVNSHRYHISSIVTICNDTTTSDGLFYVDYIDIAGMTGNERVRCLNVNNTHDSGKTMTVDRMKGGAEDTMTKEGAVVSRGTG